MATEEIGAKTKKDKAVSCLECRRLKLKCDRIFPCSSCRKRGVAQLCPNASLPTRPRVHLAEAVRSNASLSRMSGRIRELELALATLQAKYSSHPHPLLADKPGGGCMRGPLDQSKSRSESFLEEELDCLREPPEALTIDTEPGKSGLFGLSAGIERIYQSDLNEEDASPERLSGHFDPLKDYVLDPLYPRVDERAIALHLEGYIPDPTRAWELCDLYYGNASWLWTVIPRSQFEKEVLFLVYKTTGPPSFSDPSLTHLSITIFFMVFAIASLVDQGGLDAREPATNARAGRIAPFPSGNYDATRPPFVVASPHEQYYQLGRAALTSGPSLIEEPSISGVQITFLMAFYHLLLDRKQTVHMIWSHVSIATALATSANRTSPRKWSREFEREAGRVAPDVVLGATCFHVTRCLKFGRPPQITLSFIDCGLGSDPDQKTGLEGEILHGHDYRIRLISSGILGEVRDLLLSTTPPKYKQVLDLDHKLRDLAARVFGGPLGAQKISPCMLKEASTYATLRRFHGLFYKEILTSYLHRKYFVRACALSSDLLPNSLYFPSFFAAFRSAQAIIFLMDSLVRLEPELTSRFGFLWNHILSSALVVASIVIRHSRSVLATDAMKALDVVLGCLRRSALTGDRVDRPSRTLKIAVKLHEKAQWAILQPQDHLQQEVPGSMDELSLLIGHPYLLKHTLSATTCPVYSSSKEREVLENVLHKSLKDELSLLRQEWLPQPEITLASQAMPFDGAPVGAIAHLPTRNTAVYSSPFSWASRSPYNHSFEEEFTNARVPPYLYTSDMEFADSTAGINPLHPMFSMDFSAAGWGGAEDEVSSRGFVPGHSF